MNPTVKDGIREDFLTKSQINQDKIYLTVLDIHERYEMSQMETVTIDCYKWNHETPLMPRMLRDRHYRLDALDFLKRHSVIRFAHSQQRRTGGSRLEKIGVNPDTFLPFKKSLDAIYHERESNRQHAKQLSTVNKAVSAVLPPLDTAKSEATFTAVYTAAREILINEFLVAKPNFDSENDRVFTYLYNNPNRKVSFSELQEKIGDPLLKPLKKPSRTLVSWATYGRRFSTFQRPMFFSAIPYVLAISEWYGFGLEIRSKAPENRPK